MMVGGASFPSTLHTQQMWGRRCRCRAIASGANFCNYCHGRCSTPLRRYVLDLSVGEGYLCQLLHYGLGMCVRGNSGFAEMMNIMPHLRVITVCFFCPGAGAANIHIRMVPCCAHVRFRVHSLLPGQVWGGCCGHLRPGPMLSQKMPHREGKQNQQRNTQDPNICPVAHERQNHVKVCSSFLCH